MNSRAMMPLAVVQLAAIAVLPSTVVVTGNAMSVPESLTSEPEERGARCAAYSVAACLEALGVHDVTVQQIDSLCGSRGENTNLEDCRKAAEALGCRSRAWKWDHLPNAFSLEGAPAVLPIVMHDGRGHFVAALVVRRDSFLIVDYPIGPSWVPIDELRSAWHWDGSMLHIASDEVPLQQLEKLAGQQRSPKQLLAAGVLFVIAGLALAMSFRRSLARAAHCHFGKNGRGGFSAIELCVVLAIISLLMALILPAVQAAREAARKTGCANNLKQIGVACEAFESSMRRLPGGAVRSRDPQGDDVSNNLSPHVSLLPYLEQRALFDQFDQTETGAGLDSDPPGSTVNGELLGLELPVFVCPSDFISPRCNYRISSGTSPWMHETIPKSPTSAQQGYRGLLGRRDAEFTDGKSQTAAFAERLAGDADAERYTPWRDSVAVSTAPPGLLTPDDALQACSSPVAPDPDHFSFGGSTWALSGYPQTWYNHVLTPNSRIPDCVNGGPMGHGAFTARSLHPGGVNVLFADGSVRMVSSSVDLALWRALGTVSGSEVVAFD